MKAYDENNVFAKMLKGDIPVNKIYEDDFAIAFKDIHPKAPVHLLVIPKGAYTDFSDFSTNAPAEEIAGFFKAVGAVAKGQGLVDGGYRLVMNTGRDGGQEVPHLHVHILAGKNWRCNDCQVTFFNRQSFLRRLFYFIRPILCFHRLPR